MTPDSNQSSELLAATESACTTVSLLWRSTRSKIAPGLRSDSATPKLLSTSAFDVPPDKYDSSTMTSNVASAALNAAASAYVVVYVGVANAKSAASVTAVRPAAVQ